MPKWARITLTIVAAFVFAAAWGFLATMLGAPPMVISLGAVAIGAGTLMHGIGAKNTD